jgi:hypothetical protein
MNFSGIRRLVVALGLQPVLLLFFITIIAAAPVSPITSSVKLRVDADNGHSWGTGTIIDTREGQALILTCGHIFQGSQENGNVEVHLFGENSTVKVFGKCLYYDLEIDLALVYLTLPCPVRAVPIAPDSYRIQPSQQVLSVGCDSGGNPTVWQHQVMSIDRVSTSREKRVQFHYVQVSGAPVGGRSGGGLFSSEGYLIGVCNTGDPQRNDGHFVPPHMIRHILDKMNLAVVYQNPSLGEPQRQTPPTLTALTPLVPIESIPNIPPMAAASVPMPMYAENKTIAGAGMSREEQATLEEIKRRKQDGDEVILIVRSRRNPEIPSDVIVLNGTSDQFLNALVKNPVQPPNSSYNPVIFSSHEAQQPARTADRQPVSFPVRY